MTTKNQTNDQPSLQIEEPALAKNEIDIIAFIELARPFAAGNIRLVSPTIDFTEVVQSILDNNTAKTQQWLANDLITVLDDDTASYWIDSKKVLKAAVLAPWVFVQDSVC